MKHTSIIYALAISIATWQVAAAENFISEEVEVKNHEASVTLAGTLTTPTEGVPKGAIVLATGSGAQNRDEEILGHKPFKLIAETLSAKGYAVLRMDDRGTGKSTGNFSAATTDDFATDIAAGIDELKLRFNNVPTGILGHSEGGTIAIKEAVSNPGCDFIITLGAPAWQGDSIIMSQARALAVGLTGKWDAEAHQREILDLVKSNLNGMQLHMMLMLKLQELYGESASHQKMQEAISKQLEVLTSDWYRSMIKYDPASDIRQVRKPWLALQGDRDTQVLPGNLQTISELNPMVHTKLLPEHNHLFQRCTTGLINEYDHIAEDVSPQTLDAIVEWLGNFNGH